MKSISLRREIHLLACLRVSFQLRNFLPEFIEKSFDVFDQSSHTIYVRWYWLLLFFRKFSSIILLWHGFKILFKSRGGGKFFCLALSVNVRQKFFFFFIWKLNIPSFIFLNWTKEFWIWFSRKLTKTSKFPSFFNAFLILLSVWLWSLGSDLSIDNIVQLGSANTKTGSQDAVKKVLELTEKWK